MPTGIPNTSDDQDAPGYIVLLGSGETSPNIQKVYDWLFQRITKKQDAPIDVSILETPAGFEPNSDAVAGQIGDYLEYHLQNHRPAINIIPVRKKGTHFSPNNVDLLTPLYGSNVILMGPGSPTYAVRQMQDSATWHTLRAQQRLGTALIFASATSLASSAFVLPVYEIYKVGEDLHWKQGLNFFSDFGLDLVFISHWNNNDGGDALDTSRCYMGQDRYNQLIDMLPQAPSGKPYTIVGIDENTAFIIEPATGICRVIGPGGMIIIKDGEEKMFSNGSTFDVSELGPFCQPTDAANIPQDIWTRTQIGMAEIQAARSTKPVPTDAILALVREREEARARRDWNAADVLRDQIAAQGWQVLDTAEGSTLARSVNHSLLLNKEQL